MARVESLAQRIRRNQPEVIDAVWSQRARLEAEEAAQGDPLGGPISAALGRTVGRLVERGLVDPPAEPPAKAAGRAAAPAEREEQDDDDLYPDDDAPARPRTLEEQLGTMELAELLELRAQVLADRTRHPGYRARVLHEVGVAIAEAEAEAREMPWLAEGVGDTAGQDDGAAFDSDYEDAGDDLGRLVEW